MDNTAVFTISGKKNGQRIESRILEEEIQAAVADGHRRLKIEAFGQHGIGGRLWKAGDDPVSLKIDGPPGQRTGSMGFPNTVIEVNGPASDDVGWLNAGADILVLGNAGNGAANAMAQGRIWVAGNIGARGMTMTKHNPRFDPPELWVLGSVGDYFGEFMAGGTTVICGHRPQTPDNVLGYRPLVGMVGGKVFFRGPHKGFSQVDAKLAPITDADWAWLTENLRGFLSRIGQPDLIDDLIDRNQWQLITAKTPLERLGRKQRSMNAFRETVWEAELGPGGLIGDLTDLDRSPIGVITTGEMRRFVPVWENKKYLAPCEATCPSGIPVQERWRLIREGRVDEAVDLALAYTPFPATVCGYLCPNLCMSACTRQSAGMAAVDVTQLGRASIEAAAPELPPATGHRVAVIGGGPAGISTAWQLRRMGHEAVIYDRSDKLGGKIASVIPDSRIPADVLEKELERVATLLPHVHLQRGLERRDVEEIKADFDFVVVAVGAQKPRMLPIPGKERAVSALDFLARAKANEVTPGRRVVIIGAGNVGCDVAAEAHRLGAGEITLIDIQEPASFGKEREHAEAVGAAFKWPVFTREITETGVLLKSGELLPADTVVVSIGDAPDLDFLPETVETDRGFVRVDETFRTTDDKIFAIGDAVKQGLLTDAIGAGRQAARAITDLIETGTCSTETACEMIDKRRVSLEYFDPRISAFDDLGHCGTQCSSCGACRDCGLCVEICPQSAIRREAEGLSGYEYVVDPDRCIGCGFCAGACPCGVWNLVENTPIG
jgi:NADPH-dependent glutamate synthase beta subunit-like oxidoreductase/glutamate synthase domain-containing protein 3/NAD-dependent dihydropyrimidine dehydrogenase PreA subunit